MVNKSGIFSLIDEKKFSFKNYIDQEDLYTYKIEKIFNYENYLFVIFSKLYLDSKDNKGDSLERNHLYLIAINKNERKILNKNNENLEIELFQIINNYNNQKNNNSYIVNLDFGSYKNIDFSYDKNLNEFKLYILKNNGIVEFNISKWINNDNSLKENYSLYVKNYLFYKNVSIPSIISNFGYDFYEEKDLNHPNKERYKLKNINPSYHLLNISYNYDKESYITSNIYVTNKEIDIDDYYFDYLNLLDDKIPFYNLKINNSDYNNETKYFSFSVNNKIITVRTVEDNENKNVELISVIKFDEDMILCGNDEYIMAIKNKCIETLDNKKYKYKIPFIKLKYEDIIQYMYDNLSDVYIDKCFNLNNTLEFNNDYFVIKDNLINETSIIDDDKSNFYDIKNQTVITKNLMEINYAKLYNVFEGELHKNINDNGHRIFLCMNGRCFVSNNLLNLDYNNEKEEKDENLFELVDFYNIEGRINEIYIESIDIDNNNLMCIASDRNELYIFENLFKSNSFYYKNKVEDYFYGKLKKTSLKYIYNFNNTPLNIEDIEPEDYDQRSEYYRATLTPKILSIGSSVDDITICDQYLNTLNIELTKINDNIYYTNNIKYFKLSEELKLSENDISIEGDNKTENNLFNDNENYIKLETFKNQSNTIEKNIDRYAILNFRLNINNRNIFEDDRYYTFKYSLQCTNKNIEYLNNYKSFGYNLNNNEIIYETNNIYKNIYMYIPKNIVDYTKINKIYLEEKNKYDKYTNYDNIVNDIHNIRNKEENLLCIGENFYNFPLKVVYNIVDNYFENETITHEINDLPKRLTTRDYFIANVKNLNNDLNRLYFRWRYIGGNPNSLFRLDDTDNIYDYYLLSFVRNDLTENSSILNDINNVLRNYLQNVFDASDNIMDFSINKIEFKDEYQWTSLNLPLNKKNLQIVNVIVAKKQFIEDNYNENNDTNWFDYIILEDNFNYITNINIETIRTINISYEKVKINYNEYIDFLEYMENTIQDNEDYDNIITESNNKYKIEWAYHPCLLWDYNNILNKNINLIFTNNFKNNDFEKQKEKLMENVFTKFTFISKNEYYYQESIESRKNILIGKNTNIFNNNSNIPHINKYYNPKYNSNIFKDFIKWKFGYNTYAEYEEYLWSLILDEEDIYNFKLNKNDDTFTIKDNNIINRWYITDNIKEKQIKFWEDPSYRNIWINENYMPIKNKLYDENIKIYTNESFNNGFNSNVNNDDFGLLYLSDNINDIVNYGNEKRLITNIYIDGLKLFNEGYYFKDLLNNVQDIFINPLNLKCYFANTEKFPYYSKLLKMMNNSVKPINAYKQKMLEYEKENKNIEDIEIDIPKDPEINIKDILSNIEVNTNFGLISEQEKLVATIEVRNYEEKENNYTNITKTVIALNNEGAYYINDSEKNSSDNELILDETNISNSDSTFTNQLTLSFNDSYIKDIINNNDRINLYISYKNDIGGKYARRINPKFVNISIDKQNVTIQIKGYYAYKSLSTIYIVSGDINNHNMFFSNIDKDIEYIDLAEIGTLGDGRLFKWLSYDNITSAEDIEINMNGYILYPNIDYTVVNKLNNKDGTNLILFRNIIPSNGDISIELNLRPDSNAKLLYKTNQAYSMNAENYSIPNNKNNKLKKLPLSKTITIDNDKYQFLSSNIFDEENNKNIITNKFDIYINNMKVPNKYINIVNSKTINLSVDDKDYAIDLHKTHIAEFVRNAYGNSSYKITNEYDPSKATNYRYFDPIYKNILIVFQNKYNPYNYEIEIENKYNDKNFKSLLKSLYFRLYDNKGNLYEKTDSCYVPSNSINIYDNFDWICENNGGKTNNINNNIKIDILTNPENIINCNIDNLPFNISFDSEPIDTDVLNNNIIFDCNPIND